MSRDKQIEEMAKVICDDCARDVAPCILNKTGRRCDAVMEQAEALYNAGYRKSTDVAEEIFAEIESKKIFLKDLAGNIGIFVRLKDIAELRKKYIGKDTNVTTKDTEN